MAAIEHGSKICIFGAGGPVGAVTFPALRDHYTVRLTDIVPVDALVSRERSPLWPSWEAAPSPPHEWCLCDVSDYAQVEAALEGCDAAINLTVNRSNPELAFRINVIGAYNIMKAAAAAGLKRVIHTGPWARVNGYEGDYRYEYALGEDVPYRAGTLLYPHTKGMSLHVVNAFADHTDLDIMTFWLSRLRPADAYDHRDEDVMMSFSVSWRDLARSFLCGLQAPTLPRPNEIFFICAQLPLDKYETEKAERLLGWKAQDTFGSFWKRSPESDELERQRRKP